MIEITPELRHQLERGKAVDIADPDTDEVYVLMRKDIYDRVRRLLYDDSEWTDDELRLQLARSANENPGIEDVGTNENLAIAHKARARTP
jgi:hypothetical protein